VDIAILLYDRFTALDCIGPYELLSRLPGARLRFVSLNGGLVRSDTGMLAIQTEGPLEDIAAPEIVLVPGGPGDEAAAADPRILAWLRRVHETTRWTTSVCTGSIILAAAGILKGLEATTHWARLDRLRELGAVPVAKRVVRFGKIYTAAGVSAGIDMGLTLVREEVGDDFAQGLQLAIEYDPDPPFDSGSPSKAPAHILAMIQAVMQDPTRRDVPASH
jgi:transcriptional regulator GlxA family with amidase domain